MLGSKFCKENIDFCFSLDGIRLMLSIQFIHFAQHNVFAIYKGFGDLDFKFKHNPWMASLFGRISICRHRIIVVN